MFPVDAKILIIDDSNFSRSMLVNALKSLKYWKIIEANGPRQAQTLMSEEEQKKDPIHLVFCDQQMPEVLGLEFIKWMRTVESYKNLPVVMLTSSQEKGVIIEAGKLGISSYIIKPFDLATLRTRMAAVWEKQGQKFYESFRTAKVIQ